MSSDAIGKLILWIRNLSIFIVRYSTVYSIVLYHSGAANGGYPKRFDLDPDLTFHFIRIQIYSKFNSIFTVN